MFLVALVMLLVCIGIPLAYAWRILRLDEPTRMGWILIVADAAVFVALVLLVGRWDVAGYFVRYVVLAVFLACVFWSLRRHAARPWRDPESPLLRKRWTTLVSLVLFGGVLTYVAYGMLPPPKARELAFPLAGGRFMVAQAGTVTLLNHHAGHREQRHAADITAIGPLGFRAGGIAPDDLHSYRIYGASVVSPCAGEVVATRNDLPDLIPPATDPDNAAGNHVIVDCGSFNVELAHLQPGSIVVTPASRVAAGDPVGKVGNSGNTTEPHLHVHAVDPAGEGVPVSFAGRAPVRNRIYTD